MQLSTDDVTQILNEVWGSMLGLDVEAQNSDFTKPAIAGSVVVSGAADCLIAVEMAADGAQHYAAAMFGMGADEVSTADITDAVGELTNMIGGNIKCLLPEPSGLSLPVVAQGGLPPTLKVVGGKVLLNAQYICMDSPIHITVWSRPS